LCGDVDFQIKCVREGDRLEEQIARFQPGGRYHKWIIFGEIQEYGFSDIARKARPNIPFLYFVVFSKDYTRHKTYDTELNLVEK
jgi:hypothetical protein